jgi:hypothetical protein
MYMPGTLVLIEYFFNHVYQTFIGGFGQPIPLRVIRSRMTEDDTVLLAKVDHSHGFEGLGIVSNNLSGTAESCQYVIFQEINHY